MSENTNPILYPHWNDRSSKEILKPWRSKSIYSKYFTYWGTVLSPPPLSWASMRLQSWISISVLLTGTSLPWAALDLGSREHTVLARPFVCGIQAMFQSVLISDEAEMFLSQTWVGKILIYWAEDEMVGQHHRLNGHELEQTPGDIEGQRRLACCSPWGRRESDMT